MSRSFSLLLYAGVAACLLALNAHGQESAADAAAARLTIYNQDFAVVRTTVPLTLHAGRNEVTTAKVTSHLEPDSVVLRDPSSREAIQVLEQNYDAGVVTQAWLLQKYEGKTIDFVTQGPQVVDTATGERKTLPPTIVQGRIIRAGDQPLIEVNGRMQFQLPGLPVFPVETDGLLLKPTLRWVIDAPHAENTTAELDYITQGMQWQATYNVVLPATEDTTGPEKADVMGWVTIENHTGTEFPAAAIQLMAGDVAKIQPVRMYDMMVRTGVAGMAQPAPPAVTQKAFDEFHLYDLNRTVSLKDGETKQVQFMEGSGVTVQRRFETDGADENKPTPVSIVEKIKNSEANHLGMPIPAGRLRVYRRDTDGQMQFVGESQIDHTPAEQDISVSTGRAFDVTATRRQTDAHSTSKTRDESYEIKLSNQKAQAVTVHVIEHMNGENWKITAKSTDYVKKDSTTIDFAVQVPAKGDATLTYTEHSNW